MTYAPRSFAVIVNDGQHVISGFRSIRSAEQWALAWIEDDGRGFYRSKRWAVVPLIPVGRWKDGDY